MAPLSHTLGGGAAAGETRRGAREERPAKGRRRKGCLGNLTFARFGIKRSYKVSGVKKKRKKKSTLDFYSQPPWR